MQYSPSLVPIVIDPVWLQNELRKIAEALIQGSDSLRIATTYVLPTRYLEGEMRVADGVYWDPGRGPGTYIYRLGEWQLVESGITENAESKAFFLGP